MNLRPIIERELRVAARLRTTYSNRSVPAVLLTLVTAFILLIPSGWSYAQQGQALFATLNTILFCLIWLIVPLSTADCLSREKREDTLGLLLLTPLRPFELVVAKLFSALWQSGMLMVAAIPMLAIPTLLGGVNLWDVTRGALSLVTALISAATIGVLASSLCERRGRAWLLVVIGGASWLLLLLAGHGVLLILDFSLQSTTFNTIDGILREDFLFVLPVLGWFMQSGLGPLMGGSEFYATPSRVAVSVAVLGITFLFCWQAITLAAGRVRRFAESRFRTARLERVHTAFTREQFATKSLHRSRSRMLMRNPIEWRQSRRWHHRLAKWGWLLLVITVFALTTAFDGQRFDDSMLSAVWLGLFMLLSLLLVSSFGLQDERDSGALELILVTHVSPQAYLSGRIRSLRKTIFPGAILIFTAFWVFALFDHLVYWRHEWSWQSYAPLITLALFFVIQLRCLPVIGLCFSLGCRNPAEAVINSLAAAVLVPWFGVIGLVLAGMGAHADFNVPLERRLIPLWSSILIWSVAFLALATAALIARRRLNKRGFMLETPAWFSRSRIGPLGAILLPLATFVFLQLGGGDWLDNRDLDEEPLLLAWLATGIALLGFTAYCARRTLLRLLEQREFGQPTPPS